jgi:hypothetical protein
MKTMPLSMRSATRRALLVGAEHRPAEAVRRLVGQGDGLVVLRDAVNDGHGSEQLLVVGAHGGRHAGEHRRLDERARKIRPAAADEHRRAAGDRVLDLFDQGLRRTFAGQRAERRRGIGVIARPPRREAVAQPPRNAS